MRASCTVGDSFREADTLERCLPLPRQEAATSRIAEILHWSHPLTLEQGTLQIGAVLAEIEFESGGRWSTIWRVYCSNIITSRHGFHCVASNLNKRIRPDLTACRPDNQASVLNIKVQGLKIPYMSFLNYKSSHMVLHSVFLVMIFTRSRWRVVRKGQWLYSDTLKQVGRARDSACAHVAMIRHLGG